MNQLLIIGGIIMVSLQSCDTVPDCKVPLGHWSDREGQDMIFMPDGRGLWLTKFGSQYDTQTFIYKLICTQLPATIEMQGFTAGPYTGRTVFGIFEWSNDSTLRFQINEGERPEVFDSQRAIKLSINR